MASMGLLIPGDCWSVVIELCDCPCVRISMEWERINGIFVPLPTCWPRFCKPTCYVTTSCFFSQLVHLSVFFVFVFALFGLIAPAQMIKRLWIRGFLPACNWGNHVSVLVRTTGASRQPLPRASRMVDPGQINVSYNIIKISKFTNV